MPCEECCERLYDLETGKPKEYRSGPFREIRYYEGPDHAPACRKGVKCPKESPEKAKEHEWTPRNFRCFMAYRLFRIDPAAFKLDNFARDMFALLAQVEQQARDDRQSKNLGRLIAASLAKGLYG